ncbi:MAG: nickel-dependent hydrogenase large subunit [Coriobacteriales bacterium]|jgi:hydrogenase large subunit|nr:nickel-dependent hydrogenase large subunit [Coriobacteriales bacterium]
MAKENPATPEDTQSDSAVKPDGEGAAAVGDSDAASGAAATSAELPEAPEPVSGEAPAVVLKRPSGVSIIDPVNRIEGHLRIDMEVENGKVANVWASGGLFRGMELVLEKRKSTDAPYISQRICGVCPVSHAHASSMAAEKSYGIEIPSTARIIRNIVEGAQFLHSHILWFYNLAALDYVNPLNALTADIADTVALANAAGTTQADFANLKNRLQAFADNGQLSLFSGHWFNTADVGAEGGKNAYQLPAELDLIATAHYLEALEMQALSSEISGIIGGKMPHIMTSIPGGTTFVPTEEKLDDLLFRAQKLAAWVTNTMIPDTLAIAPFYMDVFGYGDNAANYIAWGVFDEPGFDPDKRYLPGGVWSMNETSRYKLDGSSKYKTVQSANEALITETTVHSFYEADDITHRNPSRDGITRPLYYNEAMVTDEERRSGKKPFDRYTWDKAARYDKLPFEAGGLSRLLVAYNRGIPEIVKGIDGVLTALGVPGRVELLNSTMGRTGARNIETQYVANKMVEWVGELIEAIKGGDTTTFKEAENRTGEGFGMWEAPRGALYHYMSLKDDIIDRYQIIIPSTWNISPRDDSDVHGPMEQSLLDVPVEDMEQPIHALRTVHSFDPCVACAVHITEPATGKKFSTVTNPWGVK